MPICYEKLQLFFFSVIVLTNKETTEHITKNKPRWLSLGEVMLLSYLINVLWADSTFFFSCVCCVSEPLIVLLANRTNICAWNFHASNSDSKDLPAIYKTSKHLGIMITYLDAFCSKTHYPDTFYPLL